MKSCLSLILAIIFLIQGGSAVTALDSNPYHQLPAAEGRISYFASDDRTGICEEAAFGELLGERCGTTDATKFWYVAMRWPYNTLSGSDLYKEKDWWHNKKILVTNPSNGKMVVLAVKDWGPAEWTGRVIDISKTALDSLGAKTDDVVKIEFADQSSEPGIVQTRSCKIPVFDQTKYSQKLGTCNGCTITSDGCVVTSLAMVFSYYGVAVTVPAEHSSTGNVRTGMDPAILDDWFTWKEGYDTNTGGCPGKCLMNWKILPGGLTVSDRQYNPKTDGISEETYNFIDSALASGNLVIAGVHWDNKKENSHFVVITRRVGNTYAIIDPMGGTETTLEKGVLGSYIIDYYRSIRGSKTQCSQVSWNFDVPGDLEGWEPHNVEDYSVEGGRLFIDPALDPWIQSPLIRADAESYNAVEFNMSSNAPDDTGTIYFTTADSPVYGEDKKVGFTVKTGLKWHRYNVYMAGHPGWKGQITGIRIDPANNGKVGTNLDTVGFDYIRMVNDNPRILAQSIYPNNPVAGEKLDFVYNIENPFSNEIENVKLGARIRMSEPQGEWLDDRDRDRVVTLTPGKKDYSRSFERTQGIEPVFYDAQWIILDHSTGTWLDHQTMMQILKVSGTPSITSTPVQTPGYTPTPVFTPGYTPAPGYTSAPVLPSQKRVDEIVAVLVSGFEKVLRSIAELFSS
ncbi:MAG: hypothetical protein SCH66_12520 [Methanolobus sp.]|nr:hypothetical protein [Methanolobus sp.]